MHPTAPQPIFRTTGRSAGFLRPGLLLVLLAVFCFFPLNAAFRAGEETDPPLPGDPDIYLATEQPKNLYQWFQTNPFMVRLAETPLGEDLRLSRTGLAWAGLQHKLQDKLGLTLESEYLQTMLDSPGELALWNCFSGAEAGASEDLDFVAVKEVTAGFSLLAKLAEVYQKAVKGGLVEEVAGTGMLVLESGSDKIYYAVKNNRLVMGNRVSRLEPVMSAATPAIARNSDCYRKYFKTEKGKVKVLINLLSHLRNFEGLLQTGRLQLALNLDLEEEIRVHSAFVLGDEAAPANQNSSLDRCQDLIPAGTMLAASMVYRPERYLNQFLALPAVRKAAETAKLDLEKDLLPNLSQQVFISLDRLKENEPDAVLNGIAGIGLKKEMAPRRAKLIAFLQELMASPGNKMKGTGAAGFEIFQTKPDRPAFCIHGNWLLIGTGPAVVQQAMEVAGRKKPGLGGTSLLAAAGGKPAGPPAIQILFNSYSFFAGLERHFRYLGKAGSGFNSLDVDEKISPVTRLCQELPAVRIELFPSGNDWKGTVSYVRPAGK